MNIKLLSKVKQQRSFYARLKKIAKKAGFAIASCDESQKIIRLVSANGIEHPILVASEELPGIWKIACLGGVSLPPNNLEQVSRKLLTNNTDRILGAWGLIGGENIVIVQIVFSNITPSNFRLICSNLINAINALSMLSAVEMKQIQVCD